MPPPPHPFGFSKAQLTPTVSQGQQRGLFRELVRNTDASVPTQTYSIKITLTRSPGEPHAFNTCCGLLINKSIHRLLEQGEIYPEAGNLTQSPCPLRLPSACSLLYNSKETHLDHIVLVFQKLDLILVCLNLKLFVFTFPFGSGYYKQIIALEYTSTILYSKDILIIRKRDLWS